MKTKTLFICLLSLLTFFNLKSQTIKADAVKGGEPIPEYIKGDVVENLDSLGSTTGAEKPLEKTIVEVCDCSIKVKLFNKRFWLAESTTLEELVNLLKSGGRILKTKRLSKMKLKMSYWQKEIGKGLLETLLQKTKLINCDTWLCKMINFLEKAGNWVIDASVGIKNVEQREGVKD